MKIATYYRLSFEADKLPISWSYAEPWELVEDGEGGFTLEDYRSPGFQVWSDLASIIVAAAGHHNDGDYSAADYPFFFSLDSDESGDGCGEWYAIDSFENLRRCKTADLVKWCIAESNCGYEVGGRFNQDAEADLLRDWIENNLSAVQTWLASHSETITATRIETLPCPEAYQPHSEN